MAHITSSPARILNSWKEIAVYLDRGTRTVQRWEHNLGLPVHRIGQGKRSPVFATATELNFWLSTVEADRSLKSPQWEPAGIQRSDNPQIESLRRLRLTMRNLSQTVAEASVRQRRQAELAKERMIQLRSRIHPPR
jgi:hypothetical protein